MRPAVPFPLRLAALALACAATAAPAAAQLTLADLCRRADLVVAGKVVAKDVKAGRLVVEVRTERALRGRVGQRFLLDEPEARHCGSALHPLAKGLDYLFLGRMHGDGIALLGGSRGVLPRTRATDEAVEELCAATDPATLTGRLVRQLGSGDLRVREDAALALPYRPDLATLAPADRRTLVATLEQALAATPARSLPSLALAAGRADPARTAALSWSLVTGTDARLAGLGEGLLRRELPATLVIAAAPRGVEGGREVVGRVLRVLAATGSPKARPLIEAMLAGADPALRREGLGLLLGLGEPARSLALRFGSDEVRQAELARERPGRFRAIRPR